MQSDGVKIIVVDSGYSRIKVVDSEGSPRMLRNAYISSSSTQTSIPIDKDTRKVTLQLQEEGLGLMEETRIYGLGVSHLNHVSSTNSLKASEARFNFASILSVKENNQKLKVVYIHNEESDFKRLRQDLLGHYKVVINDIPIMCEVVEVTFEKEGVGTYHYLVNSGHKFSSGDLRILDLGLGLANDLIISSHGKVRFYKTTNNLSVINVAKDIYNSTLYQSHMGNFRPNLGSISDALEYNKAPGSITIENWEKIKGFALIKYFKRVQQHLDGIREGSNVHTYVLTGGGSQLLRKAFPELEAAFLIPEQPEIASLLGTLISIKTGIGD